MFTLNTQPISRIGHARVFPAIIYTGAVTSQQFIRTTTAATRPITAITTMSDTPSHLTPQEQARIRRERRQAKLHDGANSRLNRIMVTQGSDFRAAAAAAAG